jgi:hypothetical protein
MKAKIISKLETSDHDGYCSGEDCQYECKQIETVVELPNMYKLHPKGKLSNLDEFNWVMLLPEPELNKTGSYYCNLSNECETNGLDLHDYKYTILSVEIIDNEDKIEHLDMKKIYED